MESKVNVNVDPTNYIYNTRDSVQTAGRIEYSLDPKYIVKNTPFSINNGFYSKLLPQFPQLENERTMELSKKMNEKKENELKFIQVLKSPVTTITGILSDPVITRESLIKEDRIIGFGMLFIYMNLIFGI